MPIKASAKKALRTAQRKEQENRLLRLKLKTVLKKAQASELPALFSLIDKAAKRRIIHPNRAARLKSRFSKKFAPLEIGPRRTKKIKKKTRSRQGTPKAKKKTKR